VNTNARNTATTSVHHDSPIRRKAAQPAARSAPVTAIFAR